MKRIVACLAASLVLSAAHAATPGWLAKEFVDTWNKPGESLEDFLNKDCQPASLDGIQIFAVQKGHDSTFNVHVYCRHDASRSARYKVSMVTFSKGAVDKAAQPLVETANMRVGPFFFGQEGGDDGLLLIEKTH